MRVRTMRHMPMRLAFDDYLDALQLAGSGLQVAAGAAGLEAQVPTCAEWDVAELVAHQGMVHRWAAANLRGEREPDTEESLAQARTAPDLLAWFAAGLEALTDTLRTTSDDAEAVIFLADAPVPRWFWARRQAHETTIHGVDAVSAVLARRPSASDVTIPAAVAVDGIDELLCGFVPRRSGRLRADEPFTVAVRATDTGDAWSMRISADPVVTTPTDTVQPDAVLSGTAVQLYLGLWNRSDEIRAEGRADVLDLWRTQVRVRWS